jgi:FtsP/CotA-like multicopper oxidase with cupredoxin domain
MVSSRRAFIATALAGLGGGAYWLILTRGTDDGSRLLALPRPVPPTGRVHECVLEAKATDWAPIGGTAARAWTYNGTVPGPEIRLVEGDRLRVTLRNLLEEPTSIHWHGLQVPFAMDGVPDLTQPAVPPRGTFVYEFTATRPGTYWYHTHFGYQLDRGLYGPLVVEPAREKLRYDQEYTLLFDDWLSDPDHPRPDSLAGGMMSMGGMMGGDMGGMGGMMGGMEKGSNHSAHAAAARIQPIYDGLIVNGRGVTRSPELRVRRGDRVRLRLINAGSATLLAVRVMGHSMRVTHADGQPVEPVTTRIVLLGMGERLDVIVEANHPGIWPITAFGQDGQRVSAVLRYDGAHGTAPDDTGNEVVNPGDLLGYSQLSGASLEPADKPDRQYELELSGGMMDGRHWTINGREYPDVRAIQVHEGERVRLEVGNMSMVPHPVHLHGHFFRLREFNGERLRRPILKDTITLGHMESFVADVVADNPGARWLLHCHNLYHHMGGMAMELRYV